MSANLKKFLKLHKGKRISFTNGCFDVLHIGHLSLLKEAKKHGDILVVGLNSDASVRRLKGQTRPINNQHDRKSLLEELRCVDFVEIFEENTCESLIKSVKPDAYFKSSDKNINSLNKKEKKELFKCKTEIKFIPLIEGLSSSNILTKI